MESFITAAIVGTDQSGDTAFTTSTQIDNLTSQLPESEKERRLLLIGGAWGAYTQAGQIAQSISERLTASPPEAPDWRILPRAHTLETALTLKESKLLLEAFALMREHRYHVPFPLLPQVLDYATGDKSVREAAFAVIGERGIWLSNFNSQWKWVEPLHSGIQPLSPEEIENLWQEGTLAQRVNALAHQRQAEPALARQWLEKIWKHERAEARTKFLEALAVQLSPDDEAFLESALDDRAEAVREQAVALLSALPESSYLQRLSTYAERLVQYRDGELTIQILKSPDDTWLRDVLVNIREMGNANRRLAAYTNVLKCLPLEYWEERFQLTPAQLLSAVKDKDWRNRLFTIWGERVQKQGRTDWASDLLDYWNKIPDEDESSEFSAAGKDILKHLYSVLPQEPLEKIVKEKLTKYGYALMTFLDQLPASWSHDFSLFYLQWVRNAASTFVEELGDTYMSHTQSEYWHNGLARSAYALAPSCFESALKGWELPELPDKSHYTKRYNHDQLQNGINRFLEVLQYRKNILEEIQ